jgi:hypothetical protein
MDGEADGRRRWQAARTRTHGGHFVDATLVVRADGNKSGALACTGLMVERHGRRRNGVNRQHFLEQYLNISV